MNVAKYYRERNGRIALRRVRFFQSHSQGVGIARIDKHLFELDFTRPRPSSIKPHSHPHQQPGYRQPSEQQRRRARQTLGFAKSKPHRARGPKRAPFQGEIRC